MESERSTERGALSKGGCEAVHCARGRVFLGILRLSSMRAVPIRCHSVLPPVTKPVVYAAKSVRLSE